ncbi:MAG TPA: flagellar basal-body MS-ring/collar protein FliF [Rhodanobacteraceae bacterium]|nr:flagellar basal-body MS-ring/collar protein FliF [Rhodanobacteraceae bacterium]
MADTSLPARPQDPAPAAGGRFARYQSLADVLHNPAVRQAGLLVGIAAAVALGMGLVLWSRAPDYTLLYSGLTSKDASSVVQDLQRDGVPYQLTAGGASVLVPADKVDALRLRLAADGLPHGHAAAGKQAGPDSIFDMSDNAEALRDQHTLEQSLAKTIASLQPVQNAEVHLAIPQPSEFVSDDSHPSASVVVELYPGTELERQQVAAIVHLVATSVPNLDPSRVSVVSAAGVLLTDKSEDAAQAGEDQRVRETERLDNLYAERVDSLLAPIVGRGHVHARVDVALNVQDGTQASETYGKGPQALLSERTSSSSRAQAQGGVPGALSNQPPVTVVQPTAANPTAGGGAVASASTAPTKPTSVLTSKATRNFDVDQTVVYSTHPAGEIKRLTVAVAVDDRQVAGRNGKSEELPQTPAEMAALTALVRGAVGYDAARGDLVNVVNVAFQGEPPVAGPTTHFWQSPTLLAIVRQLAAVVALLAVTWFLLRPVLRKLLGRKDAASGLPQLEAPATMVELKPVAATGSAPQALPDDQRAARGSEYDRRVARVQRAAAEDPRKVAQIVRNWVAADGN